MNKGRKILKKAASVALGSSMVLTGASIAFAAGSYQETAKTSLDAMVSSVAGAVDDYAQNMDKAFAGSTGKMTLTVEDTGKAILGTLLGQEDMSWLQDLTMDMKVSVKDGTEAIASTILLNDQKLCDLNIYEDLSEMKQYIQIPEVSDAYLALDPAGSADETTQEFMKEYMNALSDITSVIPDGKTVSTLLDRYGNLVIDNMEEGTATEETLSVEGIGEDCTVYEGQISSEDAVKTATELLEAAKSDSDIESILNTWNDKLSSDENLYESFTTAVDKGLNALKDTDTSDSEDSYLSTKIWVDENGRIAGRALEIQEGDTTTPILTWQMPENGSDFGYLLTIASDDINTYSLSGSGQIDGDKLNGTYEFSLADSISAIIEVKDYDTVSAKEGNLNGNYKITFPSSDTDNEDDYYSSILENFALVLDLNSEKDSGSVALSIENAGSTLGTLSITGGAGEAVEIPDLASLKDVYDANNNDDMNAYAATLDFTSIMDNLSKAGVPDEVITYILSGGSATEDSSDTEASENSETSDNASDGSDTDAAA
mgnify:CR=1 FL=1